MISPLDVLRALRPKQWTKNAVVSAAYVFALGDQTLEMPAGALTGTVLAVLLFCLSSSAVYLINDVRDYDRDRLHPTKKYRVIPSDRVPRSLATVLSMILAVLAPVTAALLLTPAYAMVLVAYLIMQAAYTAGLKHVAFVDVLIISTGFVLRALGGALAISVPISRWLLVCTFLLSLFLALSKRRHEKVILSELKDEARPSLKGYTEEWLDRLILLVSGATVTAYLLYTISPDAAAKFGDQRLAATVPFVVFGIGRYWHLVYREEKGGRPERVLLTDIPTLANLALYGATLLILFHV